MTTGEKIARLRKEHGLTQEQLAEKMEVSRQSVSKWESDLAFPETEKLIALSMLFGCSTDHLLKEQPEGPASNTAVYQGGSFFALRGGVLYEYKSKRVICGLPLVHVHIGLKGCAHGVFAFGLRAKGVVSFGLLSMGLLSFGVLSMGLLAFGTFALGLLAFGAVAAGLIAVGAVALGVFALGACAVGLFSVGAAAFGHYFALGDVANAKIALGASSAQGEWYTFCTGLQNTWAGFDKSTVTGLLDERVPWYLHIFAEMCKWFL